ncbi:MAG: hypothetical protein EXR72_09635 [Myxococcales bacterium]|nr:hypothetical protein [Myxococcales bacterium]
MEIPSWWEWELDLTPHVEKRMEDRNFPEIDLRSMLHQARSFHADSVPGRFVVDCSLRQRAWQVIVEPDVEECLLVVVTA